jgi:predicted nucleic acid-binding protein
LIILDTNVVSELMRSQPHAEVVAWTAAQPRAALFTTSFCKAEIFYGIAALPDGRRRQALARTAEAIFAVDFAGRVLGFNENAASFYAEIIAKRRRIGRPIETFDALIAATALAAGASVATRDIGGFTGVASS